MITSNSSPWQQVYSEIGRIIVGQHHVVERLIAALIADGHVLLEGVPGLAKTKLLNALATCLSATMNRVQFTPDVLPSDLVGTEVYRPQSGDFVIRKGPVFTNILLADEINRAPAKVQSALLQAMQERAVTIGNETFQLPTPFMVLATQNPIEQEGTYPLPEAQVDRFLMKLTVDYPSFDEEISIIKLATSESRQAIQLRRILNVEDLLAARRAALEVTVDDKIDRYIVSLVQATRDPGAYGLKGLIEWGASPRASIALRSVARALAFIRGQNYVSPEDVKAVAADVLRHRILTSYEAEARGTTSADIISTLLRAVTVP